MDCGNEIMAREVLPGALGDVCAFYSHTLVQRRLNVAGLVAAQRREIQTGGAMLQKLFLHRLKFLTASFLHTLLVLLLRSSLQVLTSCWVK